jgi:hypothetical protein
MIHAAIWRAVLSRSSLAQRRGLKTEPGIRVMSTALLLLAIGFLHYVPVFATRKGIWGIHIPLSYMQYTSVFDLLFEILLGFGTVMVLMEGVRNEWSWQTRNYSRRATSSSCWSRWIR